MTPYFTQHSPPALVATLPPIEQISKDEGSGGYQSPCSPAARFTSALKAPGCAIATWQAGSISTAFIRSRLRTRQPSTAVEPPDSPLPAPRGTTLTPCSAAHRTAVCTCSALSARTTAAGVPADWSRDQSKRYFSIPSASVTTTPSGSAATRSATGASTDVMGPCNHSPDGRSSGRVRRVRLLLTSAGVKNASIRNSLRRPPGQADRGVQCAVHPHGPVRTPARRAG